MNHFSCAALVVLLVLGFSDIAEGQVVGGPMLFNQNKALPIVTDPQTFVAQQVTKALDQVVDIGEFRTTIGELDDVLGKVTELPVFIDLHAIAIAELDSETVIESSGGSWPLRSALRKMLQPHGLKVSVEDEGLVVTADFTQLARRGIAIDRWVSADAEAKSKMIAALNKKQPMNYHETPLDEVVADLSQKSGVDIIVDARALEEIGLSPDAPVNVDLKRVSLQSGLRLMLRDLDLTYNFGDDVMQITTRDASEATLLNRIYYLEATGFALGDFQNVAMTLEVTITPDTWEALGGPSTIVPLTQGQHSRPAILVSTTSEVHVQIADLFAAMRKNHVGADPIADRAAQSKSQSDSAAKPVAPTIGGAF